MVSVYKRTKDSRYYQARIVVDGRTKRVTTNQSDKRKALAEAQRLQEEADRSVLLESDLLLTAAADRFFERKTLAPKTIRGYEHSLVNILEILGDFSLRTLTVKRIAYYVNTKLETTGGPQIRQDLAFLSSVMNTARSWDCGVERNVVKDFQKDGIPSAKARNRWLRPAEFDRLLAACKTVHHRRFIILAVFTGLRHQELVKLHWDEVDLKQRMIILQGDRTKNGRGREVPLTQVAYDTLCDTPAHRRAGWVFPGRSRDKPINHFGKAWLSIRKRAGLPWLHIHDLRHTFASWWLQNGGSEIKLQSVLGHSTASMTRRYAHPSWESLRAEATVLDRVTLANTRATDLGKGTPASGGDLSVPSKG